MGDGSSSGGGGGGGAGGYDISTSATSGTKSSIGPVTFGGVSFGNASAGTSTTTILLIVGAALAALFLFRNK